MGTPPAVVALGGGHGLHATLSALRHLHVELLVGDITAIVTVADNGGSSGRLRGEFGVLPPGDLRMALAALCGEDEWGRTWASVFQHRFAGTGEMQGHALGNLLIVGLWELMGDHVKALDWAGTLLGARGRVLPMSLTPLDIHASVRMPGEAEGEGLTTVQGQVEVASTRGEIVAVTLVPEHPEPCPEAVQAVLDADWVLLGPGSWYTSVLPNLMVPSLRWALTRTRAQRVLVLNLEAQEGETTGFAAQDHLRVLRDHAPDLRIDVVLADPRAVEDQEALELACASLGAQLVMSPVGVDGEPRHDVERLSDALGAVVGAVVGD